MTINAPDDWNDHKSLLERGFSEYTPQTLVKAGDILGAVEIAGGAAGQVRLLAAEDFVYALRENESWYLQLPAPGFVYAPVAEGQSAGYAHIFVENKAVGKIPVIYAETVERECAPPRPWWRRIFSGGQQ